MKMKDFFAQIILNVYLWVKFNGSKWRILRRIFQKFRIFPENFEHGINLIQVLISFSVHNMYVRYMFFFIHIQYECV